MTTFLEILKVLLQSVSWGYDREHALANIFNEQRGAK